MTKRKERILSELYDVTEKIMEPEITPVLKGSCRIQGPVEETDQDVQKNTRSRRGERRFGGVSLSEKFCMREESGTCNVCAAPCSSCMHFDRVASRMDVKSEDECSDGTSRGKEASRCSFSVTGVLPISKNITLQKRQCAAASETSNVFSACSSHDSFSENAESKATEDIEMLPVVSSGGTLECHGDNISCVSGVNDAGPPVADHPSSNMKWKNVSSSSASVSSLHPKISEKDNLVQLVTGSVNGIKCEVEENRGKFRKPSVYTKEIIRPTSAKQEVHLEEIRSPSSRSRSGKLAPCNADNKDLKESSSSQRQADPFELLMPNASTANSASTNKQTSENRDENLAKLEHNKTRCMENGSSGQEAGIDVEIGGSPSESVKCLDLNEIVEKPVVLPESSGVRDSSLQVQSQPVDESDGSEVEEDVKVCDICGDAGREDLLAVCSRCGDGAEHTYCMREMVDKVPEGDWLCEECKFKEDAEKQKRDKPEAAVEPTKQSCIDEKESTPNVKVLNKSDVKALDAESKLSPKIGSNVNISSKRHLDNVEGVSAVKRQAFESSSGLSKPSSSNKEAAVSKVGSFKSTSSKMVQRIESPTSSTNPSQNHSRQHFSGTSTLQKSNSFTEPKGKSAQEDSTLKFKLSETKKTSRSSSFDHRSYSTVKEREDPPRLASKDDLRGSKVIKDCSPFERKNSSRPDRSAVPSPKPGSGGGATPKADKSAHQGESASGSFSATNGRSIKGGSGDLKRQSSVLPRGITASPKSTMNLLDRKPSKVSLKDEPAGDGPGARFLSDAVNKRTKLKAADEVLLSKRSGEHKKSGTPDQSEDLTMSCDNVSREVVSSDQTSISSSCLKGLTSNNIVHDGQENFKGVPSSVVSLSGILSIPQYDYIWQGGFEVQKSERVVELFDGIQAHLSMGSSPKVPEVVSKFPYKVLLEEVPRSTAWPAQIQHQATEENIGVYFFAKDIESYERNYKRLLENMIKEDLALKGNFNGIELLIFPSNQLHERSQRWNTLFYMWGVFKGRRVDESVRSQKETCGNSYEIHLAGGLPYPAVVDSQREGLSGNVKGLSASSSLLSSQEAITYPPSSRKLDKSCHKEGPYLGNEVSKSHVQAPVERKGRNMLMDDDRDNVEISEKELDSCSVLAGQNSVLQFGNNRMLVDLNKFDCSEANIPSTSSDWKEISSGPYPVTSTSPAQDSNPIHSAVEKKIKDISNVDEVIPIGNIKDEDVMLVDTIAAFTGNLLKQEDGNSSVLPSSRKRPCPAASDVLCQGSAGIPSSTSHSIPLDDKSDHTLVDEKNECKKLKTSYGCNDGSSSSTGKIYLGGSFPMKDRGHDAEENMVTGETRKSERFIFPVDLNCSSDWPEEKDTMPLQVISSDDEDQPEHHFPNLELGLGGKMKPTLKQGGLPFFARLDGKKDPSKHPDDAVKKSGSLDVALGSLSLSLAFPLSSVKKEQTTANSSLNHLSIPGQLLPERRSPPNIDTSVLDLAL
ncbi:uncharacterized protein LOC113297375 isoform X2 [Papaver somniferum]|uniref:uncharacterized protein LOC113297375 isoform X2 n=1 Tax=Papaver somniferum TaxID=3469 RepID=UPI000E701E2F|nr:uncharacterized protein LOC113297375 isoform X2 [Papaver somniferum]